RDELRVTVVATGLGVAALREEPPVKLVEKNSNGEVDYQRLERPTVIRKRASGDQPAVAVEEDFDYLDIPAFLRRQAD
ncbi:MAG: cell division protein FtsZ, partial [Gammaproteobacteria bacterium]